MDKMLNCKKCTHGNKVTVEFPDATYTFHAQWLHDARCDDGPSKNATTAICQQPVETVHAEKVELSGERNSMTLDVTWDNGVSSKFPGPWLAVMAPLVARVDSPPSSPKFVVDKGWLVESLVIPEISYDDLFSADSEKNAIYNLSILDKILDQASPGIIKIINLPPANLEEERATTNTLNTIVLKRLFGSVFAHPLRAPDTTFNVSSHSKSATRAVGVPNYDISQRLLPHSDHAFYDNPIQVQGFYGLEGESENTWVSVPAALATFHAENPPEVTRFLYETPMTLGRLSRFYDDPLFQETVDTAIVTQPGATPLYADTVDTSSTNSTATNGATTTHHPASPPLDPLSNLKRIRWHPNLTGSLLAPYDTYRAARRAHQIFQSILQRPTHLLRMPLLPGDLYIWDNFRLLHGREAVVKVPRTGVGQTVPEQVVHDRWRKLCCDVLMQEAAIDEGWLVHLPMRHLREMLRLVKGKYWLDG